MGLQQPSRSNEQRILRPETMSDIRSSDLVLSKKSSVDLNIATSNLNVKADDETIDDLPEETTMKNLLEKMSEHATSQAADVTMVLAAATPESQIEEKINSFDHLPETDVIQTDQGLTEDLMQPMSSDRKTMVPKKGKEPSIN
jgi:hypothetical protein